MAQNNNVLWRKTKSRGVQTDKNDFARAGRAAILVRFTKSQSPGLSFDSLSAFLATTRLTMVYLPLLRISIDGNWFIVPKVLNKTPDIGHKPAHL